MSDSYLYENARVKALETKLVTSSQMQRLSECDTVSDAFKLLTEFGLGAGVPMEGNDFDKLFKVEEDNVAAVLGEFNVSHAFDALLLKNDYLNLKTLIKSLITKEEPTGLTSKGLLDVDAIKAGVDGDKFVLRPEMYAALQEVEKQMLEQNVNPRAIDVAVDKAMYRDVFKTLKNGDKLLKQYFVKSVDLANVLTFMRCKKLQLDKSVFEQSFIPGASLDYAVFASAYESGIDALKSALVYTPYKAMSEHMGGENFVAFEVQTDNLLLSTFKSQKDDMFSSAPILGYCLGRASDLKMMKLIVAGIKNHVAPELIRQRMRECYA